METEKQENKNPAFLFYSSDFLTGVMFMNYEEIGKYITLLSLQHQHGHLSEENMLSICGKHIPIIYEKFKLDKDGKYFNERLEKECKKREAYIESRRANRSKKTYVKHMENENVNENINIFINNNDYSDNLKDTIISWLDYKIQRNENYQERGFKALLTQIKNKIEKYGEEKMIEVITTSMASNYKGIVFDSLKKEAKAEERYKSNFERSQEALRKAREEFDNEQKTSK